jgi:hypothetical protein
MDEASRRYREFCDRVGSILADEDAIGITAGNPDPEGEYAGEAAEIARRFLNLEQASGPPTQGALTQIVTEVFRREFEEEIDPDQAARIARRILELPGP